MSEEQREPTEFEGESLNLEAPPPPPGLSYPESWDFYYAGLLEANGVGSSGPELLDALKTRRGILQAAAAHTLGHVGGGDAVEPLRSLLASSDDLVKVEAAYALARLGIPEGSDCLVECLGYSLEAHVCPAIAAGYLAQLGDPRGFPVVVRSLESELSAIRVSGCKQIFFFAPYQGEPDSDGNPIDAYRELERALRDSDPNVGWQARVELRHLDSPQARDLLARAP